MTKKLIVIIALAISVNLFAQQTGIDFKKYNLEQALEAAKLENKPLFIDCYTTWCPPCKKLAAEVFPLKDVGDYFNEHFICIAVDMESKPDGEYLKQAFEITGYPSILYLDKEGELLHLTVWPECSQEAMLASGRMAFDSNNNFRASMQKINNGEVTLDLIAEYIDARQTRLNRDSLIDLAISTLSYEDKLSETYWDFYEKYVEEFDSPHFRFFLENWNSFEEIVGENRLRLKFIRVLEPYVAKNWEDKELIEDLKDLHPALWYHSVNWKKYSDARHDFMKNKEDRTKWNTFNVTAKAYFSLNDFDYLEGIHFKDLNAYSWTVFTCYKTFDDKETLNYALKIAKEAYELEPKAHYVLDTYAHLLNELGQTTQAIEIEEKAIELASGSSQKSAESYAKALATFKEALDN